MNWRYMTYAITLILLGFVLMVGTGNAFVRVLSVVLLLAGLVLYLNSRFKKADV